MITETGPQPVKVAGFGIACIDYITVAPEVDATGYSKIQSYMVCGGGITGTSCVAASRLGASVSFVSRLGDDNTGKEILASLIAENVDTADVIIVPGGQSLFSWIRVDPDSGERYIYSRPDSKVDCCVEQIKLNKITTADVLLLDDHWPEGARYVARAAIDAGVPIVCDMRLRPANHDIMPFVDYAVISKGYAVTVSSDGTVQGALRGIRDLGAANAVVTCGEEGTWLYDGVTVNHVPAFKINAVDTTGAGDVFHGAFAFAVAKKLGFVECAVFASAVAAIKCTGMGGRQAIPNLTKVTEYLSMNEEGLYN